MTYRLTVTNHRAGFRQSVTGTMDDLLDHAARVTVPHQSARVFDMLERRGVATLPGVTYTIAQA